MRLSPNPISTLTGVHAREVLHVIGSGPSLASLAPADIGPGPVVAINFAIRTVEKWDLPNPVYSLQKDMAFVTDPRAPILAHAKESGQDAGWLRPGDYLFDCELDFGIRLDTPSVVVCLHLAKLFECSAVEYWACDSFWGDFRSYDGQAVTLDQRANHYRFHPAMVRHTAISLGMEMAVR